MVITMMRLMMMAVMVMAPTVSNHVRIGAILTNRYRLASHQGGSPYKSIASCC